MTGIGLILLLLFLVALLSGLYFAAWCICSVQRSNKEGHYILDDNDNEEDDDQDMYNKKLYAGLDMVDEAKEATYVKNPLDLDTINENKPIPNPGDSDNSGAGANSGDSPVETNRAVTPTAPEDSHSHSSSGSQDSPV